jgi:hypothetical protein
MQTICTALVLVVLVGLLLPLMSSSNCGGNSAALNACGMYLVVVKGWHAEHPHGLFHFDELDLEARDTLTDLPGASWVRSAKFWAKLDDVKIDSAGPKQVVIVCDKPFNNVPQHVLWNAPMTHAVGYSTGEAGLISPAEFSQLNLNGFVDLQVMRKKSD